MVDQVAATLPKSFKKLSPDVSAHTPRRLIMAISGREKQGKTHFALTAPGPTAYFDLDVGTEGVIEKFVAAGKVIYHNDYNFHALKDIRKPGPIDPGPYLEMWEGLKSDYMAVMDSKVKTVVFDTATEAWELLRMSRFGKLTQVLPHHYGPVNAEYRSLLRTAYMADKNLLLLHKMKAEYVNEKRTGNYERAGFADTGFMTQANVRCWRRVGENGLEFGVTVEDCRQSPEIAGIELMQPMCDFPTIASMATGTDIGMWQ